MPNNYTNNHTLFQLFTNILNVFTAIKHVAKLHKFPTLWMVLLKTFLSAILRGFRGIRPVKLFLAIHS